MTCISSTLARAVPGLSNARARARARVVETLEQSLPLALGALALGAVARTGGHVTSPQGFIIKSRQATSQHPLETRF